MNFFKDRYIYPDRFIGCLLPFFFAVFSGFHCVFLDFYFLDQITDFRDAHLNLPLIHLLPFILFSISLLLGEAMGAYP